MLKTQTNKKHKHYITFTFW